MPMALAIVVPSHQSTMAHTTGLPASAASRALVRIFLPKFPASLAVCNVLADAFFFFLSSIFTLPPFFTLIDHHRKRWLIPLFLPFSSVSDLHQQTSRPFP